MSCRRLLVAAAVAGALGLAGCGASKPAATPPVTAPNVAPAGESVYTGGAASGSGGTAGCNPVASLPALPALPAPGAMPAGSWEAKIAQRGYLIAGVDQNTYLWGYRDPETGQLSGFDIDMVRQVSQAIFGNPNQIRYVVVPNADRIADVQKGTVDIVAETMTMTCDREKSVDFSTEYYQAGQRILVAKGSSIKGPPGLAGQKVCATTGSTSLQTLVGLDVTPQVKPVQVPNQTDCLVMLQQGQVAAISTDDTILQGLAAQDPNVALVGQAFSQEPYGMAISQAHPEFVQFVNAVLEQERLDGTWAAIYAKWLQPVVGSAIPPPPAPTYQAGP